MSESTAGWLIGTPEREAARRALDVHLAADRLDEIDYQRRLGACQEARTRAELLEIFADLPEPRLDLLALDSVDDEEDMPPLAVAGCATIGLGMPVAIVLGIIYGAWWGLAVPVAVLVILLIVDWVIDRLSRRPDGA
ncbi:DUF1707 domain-containing protein [Micromonospora sp. CPCC 205371]|nr:DUF1707 domain-containing protein [Micromonospora sp. CPCC 205371]